MPLGCAAGVKPPVDPVKRIMVNVGSTPGATGHWWRPVRPDAGWCAGGVAEPPQYSEDGKAVHMGKGGSRAAA